MMSPKEGLGLSNRIRTGGRVASAETSDDGDITADFVVAWQTQKKVLQIKKKYSLGRNQ